MLLTLNVAKQHYMKPHATHVPTCGSPPSTSRQQHALEIDMIDYHVPALHTCGRPPSTSHSSTVPREAVALILPWSLFLKIQCTCGE